MKGWKLRMQLQIVPGSSKEIAVYEAGQPPAFTQCTKNMMSTHINMLKPVSLATMSWNANTEESYGHGVSGPRFDLSLRCSSFQAQEGPNPQWKSLAKRRVWAGIYKNKKQSYRQTVRYTLLFPTEADRVRQAPAKLTRLEREREGKSAAAIKRGCQDAKKCQDSLCQQP